MRNRFIYSVLLFGVAVIFFNACQNEQEITFARYYVAGKDLYGQHCQNCHNDDGKGLGELIPPLTDSVFLKNNRNQIACFIKYGLTDTIQVGGKTYQEKMPAENGLADIEIAELITYITNSFDNKQGIYLADSVSKALQQCN